MATVGTKLIVPHVVGVSAIVGQGNQPEAWVLYSTDDASVATPAWNDATAKVRSFSVSRGRESELAEIAAGTAQITLDNRARTFDPAFNSAIRPMNRWLIREQFSGETQDLYRGYVEAIDQQWPSPVGDAEAIVHCTDELKSLALDALATTSPPRETYGDLVQSDDPSGYWPLNDAPELLVQTADVPSPAAEEPPPPPPAQGGTDFGFDYAAWYKLHWRNIPE